MDLIKLKESLIQLNVSSDEITKTINYASILVENNLPVIFDMQHLRRLLGIEKKDFKRIYYSIPNQYKQNSIPKNSGDGFRIIMTPSQDLKYLQRWILDFILYQLDTSESAHGFKPNKSTFTHATLHTNKEYILKLDIKDFFPSISKKRIYEFFLSLGYTKSVTITLTNICTVNNSLPQGAPTSPYLSNLVCRNLDYRLEKLCIKRGLVYSRYADDITISGGRKVKNTIKFIEEILNDEGFSLNHRKTRLIPFYKRQSVTGITVNEKPSPPKEAYSKLRQELYYMHKYGVQSHLTFTNNIYTSNIKMHYKGKVNYIYMLDSVKGKKLFKIFNQIKWED